MDIARKISEVLEFPPDTIMDIPKITVLGNELVHVENYTALIEYKKESISLKYKGGIIEIKGENFEIKVIGEENVAVSGKIQSIKLI